MKLIELEEVDSTNDYLKREYQNLPMQTCVTAKYQTKGRGRNGHVWESHANENLIMSFLFKDFHKIEDAWKMTQLATCSVVGLLDRYRIKATIVIHGSIRPHQRFFIKVAVKIVIIITVFSVYRLCSLRN